MDGPARHSGRRYRRSAGDHLAPGTLIDYPVGVEHGEKTFSMWLSGDWTLGKKEFVPPGMLRIAPHAQPFEVFAPVHEHVGIASWYVNFQIKRLALAATWRAGKEREG